MSTENSHEESYDIAIIGMAGRFPGASDLDKFWRNLRSGVDSIGHFTEEELLDSGFPLEVIRHPDFVGAKGVLDDADMFDAAFFGISPREAELMDPQHRLLMECAWEALEDAGYDSEKYDGRISVFTSTGLNTYLPFNICSHPGLALKVGGFHLSICNDKDFVATRIAYAMNLKGVGVNISTACSSSLVSLHFACQNLLTHQSDMALVGAVTVHFPQKVGHIYEAGAAYSPDGRCRPFDATPSGLIDGNGVATVVLKRLDDARAAGDTIYAVVKGTAVNNDGREKVGYTAPSIEGQTAVICEALEIAGVDPDTISYVEAHGTATPLGDPIEVEGLTHAFRKSTQRMGYCGLGSVKSNIGHADTAAGLAGLMKIVLGMRHGQLAPSLHFQLPNPKLRLEESPFYVVSQLKEWPRGEHHPRRAGISSFGVGGTNAHAIIEEAPTEQAVAPSRPHQLLMLSARTPSALEDSIRRLANHLRSHPHANLPDVAYTLQLGRRTFNRRAVLSATSVPEAIAALEESKRIRTGVADNAQSIAFMFPGQGSQYPGMARDLYEREQTFREEIDRCAELLEPELGRDLRRILFAEPAEADDAELQQTAVAQPSLFAVEYSLAKLWHSWGIRPAAMIGHSIGEYVAACLAGVFSLPDALKIVAARGRLMQSMQPGVMLAVSLPEDEVRPLVAGLLEIAAVNSQSMCIVSGSVAAAEEFEARLNERNLICKRLYTSHAFHSSMMEPMLKPFQQAMESIRLSPPQIPFISNLTGDWINAQDAVRPAYWSDHLRNTVRFSAGLKTLLAELPYILLEVGPGRVLTGLARQIGAVPQPQCHTTLPHATETVDDQQFLLATLGQLWLSGAPVDWPSYYRDERRRRIPLPTYPFQRQRYWIEPRKPEQTVATRSAVLLAAPQDSPELNDMPIGDDTLPRHERPDLGCEYVAPSNEQETVLAEIWQELLGVSRIGIHDNFFDLGGHSLLATQILARLRQGYGARLELNDLFQNQTIAELSAVWLEQTLEGHDYDELAQLLEGLENMTDEQAESKLSELPPSAGTL
ncbi:MAG TPA: beta-ketoacyl synthase N-terminal-like domain-containing protein [Pyrinomonadaceae bacterium]